MNAATQRRAAASILGDPTLLAGIYTLLGFHAMLTGDCQATMRFAQEQVEYRHHLTDPGNQAITDGVLGLAIYYNGQYEQARGVLEQALLLYVLPGQQEARRFSQYILTSIQLHMGHYFDVLENKAFAQEPISEYYQDGLALLKAHVHLLDEICADSPEETIQTDSSLAEQELFQYLKNVKSLPRLDMIGQPLALLGYIAYRRGKMDEAVPYLEDALENGLKQGFFWVFMLPLSVHMMFSWVSEP